MILILGTLSALVPLSLDMYLPALPEIGDALHSTTPRVQLTLTACLAGLALGQLVVGPLSDALGRRRPLLLGLAVFSLATFACAVAPDVPALIACRLLQGLAGAAGIVIARAVVRDLYSGLDVARFFSTLMLVSGAAPILAPLLGGQVLRFTAWRGIFVVLGAAGAALTVVVALWLRETLPPERRHTGGFRQTRRTVRGLLGHTRFLGYVLTGAFGFAALFAYVSGSSFVVQELYGASPQTFSLLFGLNSVGMVTMGQVNGKVLVGRVRLDRVLAVGLTASGVASGTLVVLVSGAVGNVGLAPVAGCLFVLTSAMGITLPNTTAQALVLTPHAAGTASALLGTVQFLIGAVAPPVVGLGGEGSAVPMALVMTGSTVVAAAAFVGLCRPWRRTADATAG
ncbi:MFS transporter [Wenjunlia vitaminophila]|uniref:MFS transporter n=2 Tax=Wenjunlia vitaminophila TaxID=76728 RepID=A0A0T6LNQ2_WENVI|nr:MFS transporter [Wenjunlia vitaminophila]